MGKEDSDGDFLSERRYLQALTCAVRVTKILPFERAISKSIYKSMLEISWGFSDREKNGFRLVANVMIANVLVKASIFKRNASFSPEGFKAKL